MSKKSFKPGTMINPVPAVMVSCGDINGRDNIITIAWTGIVNSNPPMTYISVRKERYSHKIIKESGEFVINLINEELVFATDWCGVKSGKNFDKFAEQKLTRESCKKVMCPAIGESPVSVECKIKEIHEYGSHDMFVAEIVNVLVDENMIDNKGRIRLDKAGLIAYNHGEYFPLQSKSVGKFGYSVMKQKTKKRLAKQKRQSR